MALGHQLVLKWLSRPQASTRSPEITEVMDINIDPGYCKAEDLDKTFGSCSGIDVIKASAGSAHHNPISGMPPFFNLLVTICAVQIFLHVWSANGV